MTSTTTEPIDLRGAALFWHVMDTFIQPQAALDLDPEEFGDAQPGGVFWDQDCWRLFVGEDRCGTAFCLAGYISQIAAGGRWLVTLDEHGNTLLNGKPYTVNSSYPVELLLAEADDDPDDIDHWDDIPVVSARRRALRLLGIDYEHGLFSGGNTYAQLVKLGEQRFGPRPTV